MLLLVFCGIERGVGMASTYVELTVNKSDLRNLQKWFWMHILTLESRVSVMRVLRRLAIGLLVVCSAAAWSQAADEATQRLYAEAKSAESQGRPEEAIQKYQTIIKLHPRLAAAYNNLGHFYYEQGRLEEAIEPLTRASELDTKVAAPRALLGFTYYQMGNYKAASQELASASRLNPSDRVVRLFHARSLAELDDLKGALALLAQLQEEDPKNAEVLFTLGSVYSGLAKSTIAKIQTVAPDSYLIELLLGRYAEAKQLDIEAAEHYKKAVAKSPDVSDLHYHYAHALAASGDQQAALVEYRRALALDSYNSNASWEAARILVQDDPQEALRLAGKALAQDSQIPEAHMVRGRALLALNQPKEAVEEFRQASTLDPDDETVHFQMATAYRQLGQTKAAEGEIALFKRMQKEKHATTEKSLSGK